MSGKDEEYAWDKPKVSDALTEEQKEILEKRGVLSPEELHRLATKTRGAMSSLGEIAPCHSDLTSDDTARAMQDEKLNPETLLPLDPSDATVP